MGPFAWGGMAAASILWQQCQLAGTKECLCCCACRQEVLVRFWLQSVSRLTSAVWEDAACQALQPLLAVTLDVFAVVVQQRCVTGDTASFWSFPRVCKPGPVHLCHSTTVAVLWSMLSSDR
jgi:hypothetical protein